MTNQYFQSGKTVLFQGDSITDAGRVKDEIKNLGGGYPPKVKAIYDALFPNHEVTFINKGISGNRAVDLVERYEADFKDIAPDFVSILIGINEIWRKYDCNDPTTIEEYTKNYTYILEHLRADFPDVKIMLIEPYLLPTDPQKECFMDDLREMQAVVKTLADKYADYYLPLHELYSNYIQDQYQSVTLSEDGVHPTPQGHGLIAYEYMKILNII